MKRVASRLIGASAVALLLVACGSDDGSEDVGDNAGNNAEVQDDVNEQDADNDVVDDVADEPEEDPADDEEPADDSEPAGTVLGTVIVDGNEYQLTEMRNCEPFSMEDAGMERTLELQGRGQADGETVQIDVYVQTFSGMPGNDVSWNGPEGIYGSNADADITYDEAAGTAEGSATLRDSLTGEGSVEIEYNLSVPSDLIACR